MDLEMDVIDPNGGTQMRTRVDDAVVAEYAERMAAGDDFPPAVVFRDGKSHWLADGFHRYRARRTISAKTMRCLVHVGDRSDAIEYAIGANKSNGLRRTNADKQMAVRAALAHERLRELNNVQLAAFVGVSDEMVRNMRNGSTDRTPKFGDGHQPTVTVHKQKDSTVTEGPKVAVMSATEQKEKALELASKGVRTGAIADCLGVHRGTVANWVANPAAPTKGTGQARDKGVDDDEVRTRFESGMAQADIAEELGVARKTVESSLRRQGLNRSGKRAMNPLLDHVQRAGSQADAWLFAEESIVAIATMSSASQVNDLVEALGRLSRAAGNLKNRLNKEAGKAK